MGGLQSRSAESPPLKKGDLGGFFLVPKFLLGNGISIPSSAWVTPQGLLIFREFTDNHKSFQNTFFLHQERSEGSQLLEKARFFASLRMTLFNEFEVLNKFYNLLTEN